MEESRSTSPVPNNKNRWISFGRRFQLLLICKDFQKVEEEGNIIVLSPDILVFPLRPLLFLHGDLMLQTAERETERVIISFPYLCDVRVQ